MIFRIRFLLSTIAFIFLFLSCKAQEKSNYNFSFEKLDLLSNPVDWWLGEQHNGYLIQIDSTIVEQGKYSLNISKIGDEANNAFGACSYIIPAKYSGSKIKLTGYIKTKDVANGFAGLWLRIDGKERMLNLDNMNERGIRGTTDWKEYTIEMPYNPLKAKQLVFGAMLVGNGKIWVDNFHLFIDDKPIELASLKEIPPAEKDIAFNSISQISSIELNSDKIKLLTNLGMIWGFLKYYHQSIAEGKYNWDAELFRALPKILRTSDNNAAYKKIEQWIDSLGTVPACKNCSSLPVDKIKLKPDYGYLFLPNNLPASLINKLSYIRDNFKAAADNYYVEVAPAQNPVFTNENAYSNNSFPDAGIRLLALYRYWNMIQYFYPYRHLIGEDWNKVLTKFIPRFVNAKDSKEYTLACLEIIARIHDTHANIWSYNSVSDSIRGNLITPFKASFIENKLVVTNYYKDTLGIKDKIHIGDIIEKIDGIPVDALVKKYLPLTPASNYETQLRDMPSTGGFLLRSNDANAHFLIKRGNEEKEINVSRVPLRSNFNPMLDYIDENQVSGYKPLDSNIGYIYPAKLKEDDLANIEKDFANTKGLIIDLRCYPSTFMPFTYGQWLKSAPSPFVYFTVPNLTQPGSITYGDTLSNGSVNTNSYKGKIVIIVNSQTQSQAEYTTMALSTIPNAKVIGSTTAGADGNVSQIILPGGISTMFSGIGIYYPDGTETQRIGVKIDIPAKPTIKGILEGRDELLEKAIQILSREN